VGVWERNERLSYDLVKTLCRSEASGTGSDDEYIYFPGVGALDGELAEWRTYSSLGAEVALEMTFDDLRLDDIVAVFRCVTKTALVALWLSGIARNVCTFGGHVRI
jgi:hypothetical protein